MSLQRTRSRELKSCRFEQALNIRACNVRGIGLNRAQGANILSSYEIIQLGFVVLGNRYLMTVDNWHPDYGEALAKRLLLMESSNHDFLVVLVPNSANHGDIELFTVSSYGQLMTIHDPILNCIPWWDIDARPMT